MVALLQQADLAPQATHRPSKLVQGEEPHTPKMVMGEKSVPPKSPTPPDPPLCGAGADTAPFQLVG